VSSFNETAVTDLEYEIQGIKDLCASIAKDAHARGLGETRETRLIVEASAVDTKQTRAITGETYRVAKETHNITQATIRGVQEVAVPLSRATDNLAYSIRAMEEERRAERERHEEQLKEHKEKIRNLERIKEQLGQMLAERVLFGQAVQFIDDANSSAWQEVTRGQ
jgi:predicted  nucleic acid-binding Zn-ribbon protein